MQWGVGEGEEKLIIPLKGLYGQIPKQPKPSKTKQKQAENRQKQAKSNNNKQNRENKTGPLKTVKPL